MNSYLKEITDQCGFKKELTFHCARHTFATTVTLSNGVTIETVGKMLGHTNLRTTQQYARVLDRKVSDDMKALKERLIIKESPQIENSNKIIWFSKRELFKKRYLVVKLMEALKYMVIRSKKQYSNYCSVLEKLVFSNSKNKQVKEEIDLLTVLIEKWNEEHNIFDDVDPIRMLRSLMDDHEMKAKDLVSLLDVSKGYVSDILHYKKGLSKDIIRKLATYFKLSQEAFNRPYKLKISIKSHLKNPRNVAGTKKG